MNVMGAATNGGLFPEDGRFEMQEIPGGGLGGGSVRECLCVATNRGLLGKMAG